MIVSVAMNETLPSRRAELSPWIILAALLIAPVVIVLIAHRGEEEAKAREEIKRVLNAPDSSLAVSVNGHAPANLGAILDAMRNVDTESAHHSSPEQSIDVVVVGDRGRLELTLRRDSTRFDEYWVFWKKDMQKQNPLEIGRLHTNALDGECCVSTH
jgi:hypothetical protein